MAKLQPETVAISKKYYVEYPQSPLIDPLFSSIAAMIEACEAQNGYACEGCVVYEECCQLFNGISGASALYRLTNQKAVKYIERFEILRIKAKRPIR